MLHPPYAKIWIFGLSETGSLPVLFFGKKKKKREKQINKQKEEKEQAEEQEDVPLEMRQQVQPTEQQEEKVCVSVWRMKADELQLMVVGRGVGIWSYGIN